MIWWVWGKSISRLAANPFLFVAGTAQKNAAACCQKICQLLLNNSLAERKKVRAVTLLISHPAARIAQLGTAHASGLEQLRGVGWTAASAVHLWQRLCVDPQITILPMRQSPVVYTQPRSLSACSLSHTVEPRSSLVEIDAPREVANSEEPSLFSPPPVGPRLLLHLSIGWLRRHKVSTPVVHQTYSSYPPPKTILSSKEYYPPCTHVEPRFAGASRRSKASAQHTSLVFSQVPFIPPSSCVPWLIPPLMLTSILRQRQLEPASWLVYYLYAPL